MKIAAHAGKIEHAAKKFSGEVTPLTGNAALTKPVDEMTVPERTQAHAVLKFLTKQIEARLKELHDPLLADVNTHGEPLLGTDSRPTGSMKLFVEGSKVLDKKSVAKEPEYEKMVTLLLTNKLTVDHAYDQVPTYVYNPSKVEKLIDNGNLKAADVEALKKETHSLVVEASPELKKLLKGAVEEALTE